MGKPIYVDLDKGKRFIGMLEGGVLRMEREKSKHFYRKLHAYGIDEDVLIHTLAGDCMEFHLTETDTGQVYRIPFATFKKKAVRNQYKDHGAQLFVPIRYWYKQP